MRANRRVAGPAMWGHSDHVGSSPRLEAPFTDATLTEVLAVEFKLPRASPEFVFVQTTWAALVSYAVTAEALRDLLPDDVGANAAPVRNRTLAVAERIESAFGDERQAVVTGSRTAWRSFIVRSPTKTGTETA